MIQIVTFQTAEGSQTGLMTNGKVYPSPRYRTTMDILDDWAVADSRLPDAASKLAEREPVKDPVLLAPLLNPRNIYFAGANYKDHVEEMKRSLNMPLDLDPKSSGQKPWHSIKATGSTVIGPNATIPIPHNSKGLDWEIELAVIIGRKAKDVSAAEALQYVAGYTVANDLSARDDFNRQAVIDGSPFKWDWIGQKSFDGSCPLGPAMTPARFIGNPGNLKMKLWVNDELKQDSSTGQMIFDIAEQIEHLSSRVTLLPGDMILTGTPSGVGAAKGTFLKSGDVVKQWIENIGEFSFTIK
jgi:2-keto-4-pentenoate hydratase/2-oxohepta-3-ene-1,7-dioic acid hydratase in catechol pathway